MKVMFVVLYAVVCLKIYTRAQWWLIWATVRERSGPKSGGLQCPFPWLRAEFLSNIMPPGPRPISVPSGILIHPTIWPQYTNVTERQDREDNGLVAYRANCYL